MRRIFPLLAVALASAIGGCMVAPPSVTREVAHPVIVAAILTLALVVGSLLVHARRHHLLASGMTRLAHHGALGGEAVELVPGLAAPLVAGLWRARIYCGDDLAARLEADELDAVILHERHHRLDRAPLRLVAIAAVSPIVARVPQGHAWLERERARIEIAADSFAVACGASREALAGALLKLSPGPGLALAPGFATVADLRVRALLGEPIGFDPNRSTVPIIAAVATLIVACVVAYIS